MSLSKEEVDALRQCYQIISAHRKQWEKESFSEVIDDHIKNGTWFLSLNIKDIGRLYYPNDEVRANNISLELMAALCEGKLLQKIPRPFFDREWPSCTPTHLAGWKECPPVPKDSPLRYWLPEYMQEAEVAAVKDDERTKDKPSTNIKKWGEKELRALLDESRLPGITQALLAKKHNVAPQRISVLLKQAGNLSNKKLSPFDKYIAPKKNRKSCKILNCCCVVLLNLHPYNHRQL